MQISELEIIEDKTNLFSKVSSCGLIGINAYPVEIEIDISGGLPHFILVGLPDTAINESRERVRSAIKSSGLDFPMKKIVVNLAPADTKKAGPTYDLGIALGILAANNILNKDNLENLYVVGELGLSGKVRPVNGVLSFVILAKQKKARGIIVPKENLLEASLIDGIDIYQISNLKEAINTINNLSNTKPEKILPPLEKEKQKFYNLDLSDVKGQLLGKRGLEISASGGHHMLMIGPPGSGKSMLAQRITTILPPLEYEEKIEVTQIYSACGRLSKTKSLILTRPFRTPHHSTSIAGLIGGGSIPHPGEISLAHKGILFLDEFTEFQKQALDSLREALEIKEITISRSRKSITFPCDFTLIAACNPCPCGYLGDPSKKCICNGQSINKYIRRISGPILDRIDLQIELKRLNTNELVNSKFQESSSSVKDRVLKAWEFQKKRYKDLNIKCNSHLSTREIKHFCKLDKEAQSILKDAINSLNLTARSYDRILKVTRTIADLESSDNIKANHILEALQFRLHTK